MKLKNIRKTLQVCAFAGLCSMLQVHAVAHKVTFINKGNVTLYLEKTGKPAGSVTPNKNKEVLFQLAAAGENKPSDKISYYYYNQQLQKRLQVDPTFLRAKNFTFTFPDDEAIGTLEGQDKAKREQARLSQHQ